MTFHREQLNDPHFDRIMLIPQLNEWADIEDIYDKIPEIIICPEEMDSDMDSFQNECDNKENLLAIQARSPIPSGPFLVVNSVPGDNSPFGDIIWHQGSRPIMLPPGVVQPSDQLIDGDKMIVEGTITKNGRSYHTGDCSSGKIYINLKFTSYLPNIGGKVMMIVRLKEADRSCPWACVKII